MKGTWPGHSRDRVAPPAGGGERFLNVAWSCGFGEDEAQVLVAVGERAHATAWRDGDGHAGDPRHGLSADPQHREHKHSGGPRRPPGADRERLAECAGD